MKTRFRDARFPASSIRRAPPATLYKTPPLCMLRPS
jgi:hypothetical protein